MSMPAMQKRLDMVRPFEQARVGDEVKSIVVVTPWFPNTPEGAYAAYMYDSARSLARLGTKVSVLVCRPSYPAALSRFAPEWVRGRLVPQSFIDLHEVRLAKYLSFPGGYLRPVTTYLRDVRVRPFLRKLAQETKADLIHAQTEGMASIALDVANDLRLPTVATIHGINTDPHYLHDQGQRALLASSLRDVTRLVLVGEPLRKTFAEYAGREDHVRIVPNGVRFPLQNRSRDLLGDPVVRLVSVSNLHEGKGIDVALSALSILIERGIGNWFFTVIGDGVERSRLEEQSRVLGIRDRVRFVGTRDREGVYAELLGSDVFVLPSYREAFGIAYLEAMACGLPTIGIRGQGPEAFIEHGISGYLVEPRSPLALADCLSEIISHPTQAKEVAQAAQKKATEFSWDAHGQRLRAVYDEASRQVRA
jgi:glycosyltransferase involved in cell wall biosynthesis